MSLIYVILDSFFEHIFLATVTPFLQETVVAELTLVLLRAQAALIPPD